MSAAGGRFFEVERAQEAKPNSGATEEYSKVNANHFFRRVTER
jgi:hypothetical protein